MSDPRQGDLAGLRHLARYLLGATRRVYRFAWQSASPLDVYADTDWAGCAPTRRSTSGSCAL